MTSWKAIVSTSFWKPSTKKWPTRVPWSWRKSMYLRTATKLTTTRHPWLMSCTVRRRSGPRWLQRRVPEPRGLLECDLTMPNNVRYVRIGITPRRVCRGICSGIMACKGMKSCQRWILIRLWAVPYATNTLPHPSNTNFIKNDTLRLIQETSSALTARR